MNSETDKFRLRKKAALISLFIGLMMFVMKVVAFLITDSEAIFSDAAESVVHIVATSMALFSIILSSKPADDSHLYGHGNVEFFSAGIEGLLIISAAIVIIVSAILELVKGTQLRSLSTGAILIAIAGFINLFLGLYLISMGKKTNSLTLVADGKHVLTDSYTSIGVLIGVILVIITEITILDPLFAIAVAINILFTGWQLIREAVSGLMKETDKSMLKLIVELLNQNRKKYWIDIHNLRFWKSGDAVFVDFHLTLPNYFTIKEAHLEEDYIEEKIRDRIDNCQVQIHFDYCSPNLCKYCNNNDCTIREENQNINFDWNIEKMIGKPIAMR